ncbi:hypothetical protein DXG01_008979 [Tephrocybe rancida]|nr:hypothetical protein DXG01_008979 [Tephrocybe rancida]
MPKRLGGALEKVREAWLEKKHDIGGKRRRLDGDMPPLVQIPWSGPLVQSNTISGIPHAPLPEPATESINPTAGSSANASGGGLPTNTPPNVFTEQDDALPKGMRPQRKHRLPGRFVDFVPHSAIPLQTTVDKEVPTELHIPCFQSRRNIFGLYQTYFSATPPSHDPDDISTLTDLVDYALEPAKTIPTLSMHKQPAYYPYPNLNSFALGNWYWTHGGQKSQEDFKVLLDIIGSPDFQPEDVQSTPWKAINDTLGCNDCDDEDQRCEWEDEDAGWCQTHVILDVPFHTRMKNTGTHSTVIGDLYHRSVVSILKEKLANAIDVPYIHYEPYELTWSPSSEAEEIRVYGELFTSPALLDAHRELQRSPLEPGCNLPCCIISLMIWSDATHLTDFGTSKLWPAYLYIGNESKYRRCKPSLHLANHIAYFQSVNQTFTVCVLGLILDHRQLPDSFKDFASEHIGGKGIPTPAFLAHCRRQLFHTQWSILLDEEFLEAWIHGIVIMCLNGVKRRFYPRIITYSADYPEK